MYTPLGEKLERMLTRDEVKSMLECIKLLYDHGIIHRDLGPHNFVKYKGQFILIDFGTALFLDSENDSSLQMSPKKRYYQGSIEFAAFTILELIENIQSEKSKKQTTRKRKNQDRDQDKNENPYS